MYVSSSIARFCPFLTSILAWCVEGAKILELCQKGDKLLDEELAKVYKGKKIQKGASEIFSFQNGKSSVLIYGLKASLTPPPSPPTPT